MGPRHFAVPRLILFALWAGVLFPAWSFAADDDFFQFQFGLRAGSSFSNPLGGQGVRMEYDPLNPALPSHIHIQGGPQVGVILSITPWWKTFSTYQDLYTKTSGSKFTGYMGTVGWRFSFERGDSWWLDLGMGAGHLKNPDNSLTVIDVVFTTVSGSLGYEWVWDNGFHWDVGVAAGTGKVYAGLIMPSAGVTNLLSTHNVSVSQAQAVSTVGWYF
ncbi:MAG: hypothetical protein OEV94_01110 [Deltaproteobacteria bacterium]|nr:hypothetical protein [Deltaproteobacteria bacterium]